MQQDTIKRILHSFIDKMDYRLQRKFSDCAYYNFISWASSSSANSITAL